MGATDELISDLDSIFNQIDLCLNPAFWGLLKKRNVEKCPE
jgi:hypothetical protein